MCKLFFILQVVVLTLAAPSLAGEPKIPILHSTDLLHPYDDPDDHYDLATVFAMQEFDIRGIVLDQGVEPQGQLKRPGQVPVQQMFRLTGRKTPVAIGLTTLLRSRDDKALDQGEQFQGGVKLILSALRQSPEKVVLHLAGSCRDAAAAFNREPELLRAKVRAIYVEAGNGPDGRQDEWNVKLDPLAYLRLLESGLPIYWCPCFGRDGYATHYEADQSGVLSACTRPAQNYFVYALTRSKEEPLAFLQSGEHPLPGGKRPMWCTAPLFHAAGRQIYRRGPEDFVALADSAARRAGLQDKLVRAYEFVPLRLDVQGFPVLGLAPKSEVSSIAVFAFRVVDPNYSKILSCCLKNLLADLGR